MAINIIIPLPINGIPKSPKFLWDVIFVNFTREVENLFPILNMGRYKMATLVSKSDFHLFVINIDNNP